jgi:hypothetical protein
MSVAGSAADEVFVLALKHLSWTSLDNSRDIGLFCRELNLLDGSFDNGVHFARESALAPIRALIPQEDRKALGALVVLYPSLSFANNELTFANNLRLNNPSPDETALSP